MKKSRNRKSKSAAVQTPPLVVLADEASLSTLRSQTGLFSRAWAWLQSKQSAQSDSRRLRVAETVSLGDKRFVAVVQVAGRDFLVAGGPSNIALLAQLNPNEPFEDVLRRTMTVPGHQPAKRKRATKRKQKKPKQSTQPASYAGDREAAAVSEPNRAQFDRQESDSQVVQKNSKPARKQPAKPKSPLPPASQQSPVPTAPESAPVIPAFSVPESFRYVLQNTIATDGNVLGKPANQKNGRSETEHTGHWA